MGNARGEKSRGLPFSAIIYNARTSVKSGEIAVVFQCSFDGIEK